MLANNYKHVLNQIHTTCDTHSISKDNVTLIAVSKTKPVSMLQEVYDAGCRDFGENKVQEILDKYDQLPSDIRWHMIGHLQRNKVKYIIDKVAMIHSVDSVRLAAEIEKEAAKHNLVMPILLEVNVACEESKYGFELEELSDVFEELKAFTHVKICGLMTVAPFTPNAEDNRKYFKALSKKLVDINSEKADNIDICELSMGMSGDYLVAVEEGATLVRVGTGIFGERNYNI